MAKVPERRSFHSDGGPITRERILECALEIIDRDGIDGLSMRRLGKALGRDPMTLYRHAPNKAALLDGVAELVFEELEVDTGDGDWATQLREVARGSAGWPSPILRWCRFW